MPFPIVRITLDYMKEEIAHAMIFHLDEMKVGIEGEIRKAVDSFDFEGEVRRLSHEVIQKQLRQAVESAITHSVWTTEIRDALTKTAADELLKFVERGR